MAAMIDELELWKARGCLAFLPKEPKAICWKMLQQGRRNAIVDFRTSRCEAQLNVITVSIINRRHQKLSALTYASQTILYIILVYCLLALDLFLREIIVFIIFVTALCAVASAAGKNVSCSIVGVLCRYSLVIAYLCDVVLAVIPIFYHSSLRIGNTVYSIVFIIFIASLLSFGIGEGPDPAGLIICIEGGVSGCICLVDP